MNSVTQEHSLGCGVACVAFIVGATYKSVCGHTVTRQAEEYGFFCKDLVHLLSVYGLTYEWSYAGKYTSSDIERPGTIVYLKKSKIYPVGHYLAKGEAGWMDPWINFASSATVTEAQSGFVRNLPYKPSYVIKPKTPS